MKKQKRVLALISALVLMASVTGCSDSSSGSASETTASTAPKELNEEDKAVIADIDIGEDENTEVGTVKWFSFYDINPADNKPKMPALELFETKFGGKIEYMETVWENRYNDMANLIIAGNAPDIYPAQEFDTFPTDAITGKCQAWDDYLDFNDADLWAGVPGAKQLSDMHTINGKHYVAAVGTYSKCVMIYNKRTIEENGLDDPAELLAEDNWTWDTFRKMCTDFCSREDDKFAYDWWDFEVQLVGTTGVVPISMEDGVLVNNLASPEIERAQDFLYNLKRDDLPFPHREYGWDVQPSRIADGRTLFYPIGTWALWEADLSAYGDQGEIMFVPMPRDPKADAYYLPSSMDAYALCKEASNPEGAAAYMKCILITSNTDETREMTEKQYREDYGWTDEMIDMMHTVDELTDAHPTTPILFKGAFNKELANIVDDRLKQCTYSETGTEWSVSREEIYLAVDTEVNEVNAQIQAGI